MFRSLQRYNDFLHDEDNKYRDYDPDYILKKEARKKRVAERRAKMKAEGRFNPTTPEPPKIKGVLEVSRLANDDFGQLFSAKNATFKEGPYAGKSIEDVWQFEIKKSSKNLGPGEGSILRANDFAQSKQEYLRLWQMWGKENPGLITELFKKMDEGYVLQDTYAKNKNINRTVNQAEALTVMYKFHKGKTVDDFFYPNFNKVIALPENHIFVFGSNEGGIHGRGAAKDAIMYFGAEYGNGVGLQGNSYAIPTKNKNMKPLSPEEMQKYVDDFIKFANDNPNLKFVFTDIGTGLAKNEVDVMTNMLPSNVPKNMILSNRFLKEMNVEPNVDIKMVFYEPGKYNMNHWKNRTLGNGQVLTVDFALDKRGSGATKEGAGNRYRRVPLEITDTGMRISMYDSIAKEVAEALVAGKQVNFAGHGIYNSELKGFQQSDFDAIVDTFFDKVYKYANGQKITGEVISGGQTGFDESAIKVAMKRGIQPVIGIEKWAFRDKNNNNIIDKDAFMARFQGDNAEVVRKTVNFHYPFQKWKDEWSHMDWFVKYLNQAYPDLNINIVDNVEDADFVFARNYGNVPKEKLLGNPFTFLSDNVADAVVHNIPREQLEDYTMAWYEGREGELEDLTSEQRLRLAQIKKDWRSKLEPYLSSNVPPQGSESRLGNLGQNNRFGPGGRPPMGTDEFYKWAEATNLDSLTQTEAIKAGAKGNKVALGLAADILAGGIVPFEHIAEYSVRRSRYGPKLPGKLMRGLIYWELGNFLLGVARYGLTRYNEYHRIMRGYSVTDYDWANQYNRTPEELQAMVDDMQDKMEAPIELEGFEPIPREFLDEHVFFEEDLGDTGYKKKTSIPLGTIVEGKAKEQAKNKATEAMMQNIQLMFGYHIDEMLIQEFDLEQFADTPFLSGGYKYMFPQAYTVYGKIPGALINGLKENKVDYTNYSFNR